LSPLAVFAACVAFVVVLGAVCAWAASRVDPDPDPP
jgi:hypothetical protein